MRRPLFSNPPLTRGAASHLSSVNLNGQHSGFRVIGVGCVSTERCWIGCFTCPSGSGKCCPIGLNEMMHAKPSLSKW